MRSMFRFWSSPEAGVGLMFIHFSPNLSTGSPLLQQNAMSPWLQPCLWREMDQGPSNLFAVKVSFREWRSLVSEWAAALQQDELLYFVHVIPQQITFVINLTILEMLHQINAEQNIIYLRSVVRPVGPLRHLVCCLQNAWHICAHILLR